MISFKNLSFIVNSSGKLLLQSNRQITSKCGKALLSKSLPASMVFAQSHASQRLASTTSVRMGGQLPVGRKRAKRGEFSELECDDISFFSNLLGKHRVLTNTSEIEGYNVDWLRSIKGRTFYMAMNKYIKSSFYVLKVKINSFTIQDKAGWY